MRIKLLALMLLSACDGGFVEVMRTPLDPGVGAQDAGTTVDRPPTAVSDPEACGPRASSRLALLSDLQQLTALRAMLGEDAISGDDLPSPQLKPFMNKGTVVNTSLVHTRNEWARMASENKPPKDCADASCAETFLRSFAARAFRRPVDDEEIADLMVVYELAAQESPAHGIQRATEAVLAAPSFAYRREIGTGKDGQRALDAASDQLSKDPRTTSRGCIAAL